VIHSWELGFSFVLNDLSITHEIFGYPWAVFLKHDKSGKLLGPLVGKVSIRIPFF
jgi:hypothetical protein